MSPVRTTDTEPAADGTSRPRRALADRLQAAGIEHRAFLQCCSVLTGILALPPSFAPRVAEALTADDRPALVWLEFQDCAGDTESFLRARDPSLAEITFDVLSVDYHETLMAAAGSQAEEAREAAVEQGGHILVVEGSGPRGAGGVYCTIGGRTAEQILKASAQNAAANVGTCSAYGGLPAAAPNPTGAVGVEDVIEGVPVLNRPGCRMNIDTLTGSVAHHLMFKELPARDDLGRPLFAYGDRIHYICPGAATSMPASSPSSVATRGTARAISSKVRPAARSPVGRSPSRTARQQGAYFRASSFMTERCHTTLHGGATPSSGSARRAEAD